MKKSSQNNSISTDEWYTPKWIIDRLGPFDLDPCSPSNRPFDTATVHVTKEQDGLQYDWGQSRVWLNPPFSRVLLRQFVEKLATHGNGIALLKNNTDNLLFHEVVFPRASSMLFMRRRVKFLRPDGSTGNPFFGCVLVAFGLDNDRILRDSGIEGQYVRLCGFVRLDKPFPDSAAFICQRSAAAGRFNSQQAVVSVEDAYFALKMRDAEYLTEGLTRQVHSLIGSFNETENIQFQES